MSAFLEAEVGVPLQGFNAHRLLLSLKAPRKKIFFRTERARKPGGKEKKLQGVELSANCLAWIQTRRATALTSQHSFEVQGKTFPPLSRQVTTRLFIFLALSGGLTLEM